MQQRFSVRRIVVEEIVYFGTKIFFFELIVDGAGLNQVNLSLLLLLACCWRIKQVTCRKKLRKKLHVELADTIKYLDELCSWQGNELKHCLLLARVAHHTQILVIILGHIWFLVFIQGHIWFVWFLNSHTRVIYDFLEIIQGS